MVRESYSLITSAKWLAGWLAGWRKNYANSLQNCIFSSFCLRTSLRILSSWFMSSILLEKDGIVKDNFAALFSANKIGKTADRLGDIKVKSIQ